MGAQAWFAVGRALALALTSSVIFGKNSILIGITKEINKAIINKELDTAKMLLDDMVWRYNEEFNAFKAKYKDDLPPEFWEKYK